MSYLLQLIEKQEKKSNEIINSYKGCGRKKQENVNKSSTVRKPSFLGLCTVDTILNISPLMGFDDEIKDHPLCEHKGSHQ